MRRDTRLIHAGLEPGKLTGEVNVPITVSSTFKQDGPGRLRGGYEYSRGGNPSRNSLEESLASAENAKFARAFGSGLAACTAVLSLLGPGDEVLSINDIYGGTYRLFTKVFPKYGVKFRLIDYSTEEDLLKSEDESTKMIWLETPTNPLLKIIDIERIASGKGKGVKLIVDNTFASPYFQNPLDFGADIVIHSTTKYIGGHSDIIGGAVITNDGETDETVRFYQYAAGGVPSPFDCFLAQRGLKTLGVRMKRHEENAYAVAAFLLSHSKVVKVYFPGIKGFPGEETVKKQMLGLPGMVSFRIKGGRIAAENFFSRLRIFTFAESLGAVESLACFPYYMTHAGIPPEIKERNGITEDLVRLSVGIEDRDDLIEDLRKALG